MDWDPELYNRFRRYRAEPFEWILQRLPSRPDDRILDCGCGTGENTIELARRTRDGFALGLDSSPAMVQKAEEARLRLDSAVRERVSFELGDFRDISSARKYSTIFSNAALQWAGDHRSVLSRWFAALEPEGRLIVQMPSNHHESAQTTLTALAREDKWRALIGERETPSHSVAEPEDYAAMLTAIGFSDVDCYYRTFAHPMDNPAAIVEFTRATALRPFLDCLSAPRHAEFIDELTQRLEAAYETRGPVTFSFRRLFLWARRPG